MVQVVLHLQLTRQSQVVRVYPARGCRQSCVAVLLRPLVEYAGKKRRVSLPDFLVVGFYHVLLVQIVLHRVAQHQQVRVNPFEFLRSEGTTVALLPFLRPLQTTTLQTA